jgi:hypothetical protein
MNIVLCHPAWIGTGEADKLTRYGFLVIWTAGLPNGEPLRILWNREEDT